MILAILLTASCTKGGSSPSDPNSESGLTNAKTEKELKKKAPIPMEVPKSSMTPRERAVIWLQKEAEHGNGRMQYDAGWCLMNGYGSEKKAEEAVKWFKKAAKQGDIDAQFQLAICSKEGIGTKKDPKEAAVWFIKLAGRGHPVAQYHIGICFRDGDGVDIDDEDALRWLEKSAENGYAPAITAIEEYQSKEN